MIFVITAFLRGFVKEIFSLLKWTISLLACYLITPIVLHIFGGSLMSKLVLSFVLQTVIFIATFITFSLSTVGLEKSLKLIVPEPIDKSLGVFYGIIKNIIIFGFIYSLAINIYGKLFDVNKDDIAEGGPEWFIEAKTYNIIRYSGEFLDPVVASLFSSSVDDIKQNISNINNLNLDSLQNLDLKNLDSLNKYKDLDKKINDISQGSKNKESQEFLINETIEVEDFEEEDPKIDKDSGYDKRDIEKMNRLIDIIN